MQKEGPGRTASYNEASQDLSTNNEKQNLDIFNANKVAIENNQPLETFKELQAIEQLEEYEEPEDEDEFEHYALLNEAIAAENERIAEYNGFVNNYNTLLRSGNLNDLPAEFGKSKDVPKNE